MIRHRLVFETPIGGKIMETLTFSMFDSKEKIEEREQSIIKHRESQGCKLIQKIV